MLIRNFKIQMQGSGDSAVLRTYIIDSSDSFRYNKRPLIFVCPGGGYEHISDRESEIMALQFTAMGYHAAVLRYSVNPSVYPSQILEVAQSMKIIKEHAGEWNVIPEKVIILGCSAGGHLAASYSLFCGEAMVTDTLGMSADELRPAGMILCYPVITSGRFAHKESFAALLGDDYEKLIGTPLLEKMSLEKQVIEKTPPAFIWHTYTDLSVPVENSLLFAAALKEKNVSCELHIFPEGGHGLGLANELSLDSNGRGIQDECRIWINLVKVWLNNRFGYGF